MKNNGNLRHDETEKRRAQEQKDQQLSRREEHVKNKQATLEKVINYFSLKSKMI